MTEFELNSYFYRTLVGGGSLDWAKLEELCSDVGMKDTDDLLNLFYDYVEDYEEERPRDNLQNYLYWLVLDRAVSALNEALFESLCNCELYTPDGCPFMYAVELDFRGDWSNWQFVVDTDIVYESILPNFPKLMEELGKVNDNHPEFDGFKLFEMLLDYGGLDPHGDKIRGLMRLDGTCKKKTYRQWDKHFSACK